MRTATPFTFIFLVGMLTSSLTCAKASNDSNISKNFKISIRTANLTTRDADSAISFIRNSAALYLKNSKDSKDLNKIMKKYELTGLVSRMDSNYFISLKLKSVRTNKIVSNYMKTSQKPLNEFLQTIVKDGIKSVLTKAN
ncbi:MAG: hypothetical protein GF353_09750 [Candidatus Lokiarchaeota archaeon]|nr:hypothetical protein [Candidatus Lokiarchaeota archaeon]